MKDVKTGARSAEIRDEYATSDVVWRPTREYVENSRLWRFMQRHGIATYAELLQRANADIEWFWDATVKDLELEWFEPYRQVVDLSRGLPWTRWFSGGKYNYVHDAVDRHAHSARRNKVAVIWEGDDGAVSKLSYWDLYAEVNRLANALRAMGIGKGDRVGVFMPMIPEVVIATLACSKIGAVYIPIFSGYGFQAVASRLQDCDARLLITADGFCRRGATVPMKETADAAVALCPTVEKVLVARRTGREVPWREDRDVWWDQALAGRRRECETERTDAEDPYMIIYTSGTTGRPKGAVHVHCGFPIKAAQDMAHCFDVQDQDIMWWVTDIGWMMGPWAISGTLMLGSTLFIYEGTPDYPRPDRLWEIIERHGITHFCFAPTGVRALMSHGEEWVKKHDLSTLRIIGNSAEPWDPASYMWFFQHVGGGRCPVINYSGGTEISGGIVGCTTLTPLKPCSFSGPVPGMDADVLDEQGEPVRGAVGELVLRKPWPGMTRGFWKDPDRYLETYWSRWPNIWVHGDWVYIDDDGFWFIQGRSDDTIKVAGKRVGPAEVESAAAAHPAVGEAAAIGVPDEVKGESVVCFAVLRPGQAESEQLRQEIVDTITQQLGKALRPKKVLFVREIPKTRNGKIVRRVIKAKYLGKDPGDTSSLESQSALEEIGRAR